MNSISTHVLNTAVGRPAAGIPVTLELHAASTQTWLVIGHAETDADGRVREFVASEIRPGMYRLRFDTSAVSLFFSEVLVQFNVMDGPGHYHIPLLLSPFAYSTYRGS
jgi:hydroxyisourate hydrolase